ncbi:ABC transporter ATP-binding protein [Glutamicibacter endophyticus]|uniref:ABC transporter ATP-binding protein n=1 Tax=Glutamicibacter endophyticus TaxID=1522174 RepID=UPI003AF11ACC
MAQITLSALSKTYPGSRTPSVQGLDLEIEPGEFLCLLGPSGCGKSTTLRMIAGLENPSSGRIVIGDRVVDDVSSGRCIPAEQRGLGLVFQNYALWPHLSVRENVCFAPRVQKLPKAERELRVQQALDTLAIAELADRYPSALSGGQQQRVAIARTLAARPEVLLLDEPLSNLDARLRLEMRAEFQRLHRQTGNTMLFVTHDQFEAMTLATRIVVMNRGQIQQVGTPMEIYNAPANRFVAEFMGNPPINIFERGQNAQADAWLEHIDPHVATLGIRPEDLQLTSEVHRPGSGQLTLDLRVSALLPTGGSWIVELNDGARRYFATTQRCPQVAQGQLVPVLVAPQAVHLFTGSGVRYERMEVAA